MISNPRAFNAKLGHSLDMGVFTITPSFGTLAGTTARLRVGQVGSAARVELSSSADPSPSVFTWDASAGKLTVLLHQDHIDDAGLGQWGFQIDVIRADGTVLLGGPNGTVFIEPQIEAAP